MNMSVERTGEEPFLLLLQRRQRRKKITQRFFVFFLIKMLNIIFNVLFRDLVLPAEKQRQSQELLQLKLGQELKGISNR